MSGCQEVCQVAPGKHVCNTLVLDILVHIGPDNDTVACQDPLLYCFFEVFHKGLSWGSQVVVFVEVLDMLSVYREFSAAVIARVKYRAISADYSEMVAISSFVTCRGPSTKAGRVFFNAAVKAGNLVPC